MIFDFDLPLDERMDAALRHKDLGDVVNRLRFMYVVSSAADIGEFLLAIARVSSIDAVHRFECAKGVVEHTNKFVDMAAEGYAIVDMLCRECHPLFFRQQAVWYLMRSYRHKFAARKYLLGIVDDSALDMKQRYGAVLGIENTELSEKNRRYFIVEGLIRVVFHTEAMMYRLMAAQYILRLLKETISPKYTRYVDRVHLFLVDAALTSPDYNTRADAADVLLNSGDSYLVEIGQAVIDELGGGAEYFENAQNVHIKSIEQSCERNLEALVSKCHVVRDLDIAFSEFLDSLSEDKHKAVQPALERVVSDRAVYTRFKLTLASIFCRVWAYVSKNSQREDMATRLYEELVDSAGICSSGFMARMVNSLSGFDGFGVGIDFADQIAAYFAKALNEAIVAEECEDVLMQMTDNGKAGLGSLSGPAVRDFVLSHLSKLRETLHKEFCAYIPDTDFDLYFKRAYIRYYEC